MAELRIERKEQSTLPWVLGGLLLLGLLLWFFFFRGDGRDAGAVDRAVPTATTDATPPAVTAFTRFTETRSGTDANLAHDYTSTGLRHLADAIGAVTAGGTVAGVDVEARLAEIRERADAMQRNPASTEHALQAREAFLLASGLMRQIQEARFTALAAEVREVNEAATALKADRRLLAQASEVQRFFERAAHAVREMARTA